MKKTKKYVPLLTGAIQTGSGRLSGGARAGRRGEPGLRPSGGGGCDQLERIGPGERVAAGDHEHPYAHLGGLSDEGLPLLRGQLTRVAAVLRVGAAVHALQRAGAG